MKTGQVCLGKTKPFCFLEKVTEDDLLEREMREYGESEQMRFSSKLLMSRSSAIPQGN